MIHPITPVANDVRPRKTKPRILLSSVFGPYARNDEFGSRTDNPIELYHNQVTRLQGVFSLRMFHRTFALLLIQANISCPCTVLDFPSLDRFEQELRTQTYDIIGISSILPNIGKVRKMCESIRRAQPGATIVIGGHLANKPDLDQLIDADHIVRGDGVSWFRRFLGEDPQAALKHPLVYSGFGARVAGAVLRDKPGDTAAILIPSVGCPLGCNFCSTSAMFGGKGKAIHFFPTGDELFSLMCQISENLRTQSFFIMDENFLLHRKRSLRLLELMEEHGKSWSLYVFSSANVLRSYTIDQLLGLGISWVWMGLEGENSAYAKLKGVDTRRLVRQLQSNGVRVLGSTIIGLPEHRPENMDRVIAHAIAHDTDFHQFMLYTPLPGTGLYELHRREGSLLPDSEVPPSEAHGQSRFNFRHKHIPTAQETRLLLKAFRDDFLRNGPSVIRVIRTTLMGWQQHKNHASKRIRERFAREARALWATQTGLVWAAQRWLRHDDRLKHEMKKLLQSLYREFGVKSRLISPLVGSLLYYKMKREALRLANGWSHEPPTFYEQTPRAIAPTLTTLALDT